MQYTENFPFLDLNFSTKQKNQNLKWEKIRYSK